MGPKNWFHSFELLGNWNIRETEKEVPLIEILPYLCPLENGAFTNEKQTKKGEKKKSILYYKY